MNDSNNYYYLFSTAAQSIAAFIGLLITGYTLVLSMMEAAARADDSLKEVHDELKRQFHRSLTRLSIVTAVGMLGCFVVLFLNKFDLWWLPIFAFVVFGVVCASVIGGVWFVITIIDPARYQVVARQLAHEVELVNGGANAISRGQFLELFISIEQLLRRIWNQRTDGQRIGQRQGMPTFREMLEVLFSHGIVDNALHAQLLNVARHRNVVVHGEVDFVNPDVFREAESVKDRLEDIGRGEGPPAEPIAA